MSGSHDVTGSGPGSGVMSDGAPPATHHPRGHCHQEGAGEHHHSEIGSHKQDLLSNFTFSVSCLKDNCDPQNEAFSWKSGPF